MTTTHLIFPSHSNCRNVVITSSRLDYDNRTDLRTQTLTLVVNDTEYADYMTLIVELVDINDNSPVFQKPSYQYDHQHDR